MGANRASITWISTKLSQFKTRCRHTLRRRSNCYKLLISAQLPNPDSTYLSFEDFDRWPARMIFTPAEHRLTTPCLLSMSSARSLPGSDYIRRSTHLSEEVLSNEQPQPSTKLSSPHNFSRVHALTLRRESDPTLCTFGSAQAPTIRSIT